MKISAIDAPPPLTGYSAAIGPLDIGPETEWEPDHLTSSAWLEHVPFAFWITKALNPECFVELGTERGVSYAAFCQSVERLGLNTRCYAVDTWRGDDHAGHYDESVFTRLVELNDARFRRFSSLLRCTFNDALPYFADGEIDLLHIDGLHTFDAVSEDFRTWRPKLSDRAVVLFHDTNVRRDEFGVWRLWRELRTEYPHFEFVHGYGLGVLGVGRNIPAPVRALFESTGNRAAGTAIRGLFSARGSAVQRSYHLQSVRETAAALSAEAAALRNEAAALSAEASGLRGDAAALTARIAEREHQVETTRSELEQWQIRARLHREQIDTLERELAATRARAAAIEIQAASAREDIVRLETERARAEAEAEEARSRKPLSLARQEEAAMQAAIDDLKNRLAVAETRTSALLASTSWRVTAPMRLLKTSMSRRHGGQELPPVFKRMLRALPGRSDMPQTAPARSNRRRAYPPASHIGLLKLRVLIVAELSLPQCRKYRVDQKQAMIQSMGWDCTVVSWLDQAKVLNLLQTHSVAIFYRVPALPGVVAQVHEADRLGVQHYFELDDLIFDLNDYSANPNLTGFDPQAAKGLFEGAALYRNALVGCRNVIGSTPYLAQRMQAVGGGTSYVVENALDSETLEAAAIACRRTDDGKIRIIYGSGTKTHDADFRIAAPALYRVARENPDVRILLVGELNPPDFMFELGDQFEQLAARPYVEYLDLLAQCDIAIAPLFPANFNEAKSAIKFLEAASVGVASVCSPRSAFLRAIRPGETGYLAESETEWYAALTDLVQNPERRAAVATAARRDVLEQYSPGSVARREVEPLLRQFVPPHDDRLHILEVNLLYAPQTYGGATLVMEEMVRLLKRRDDTRVSVFASAPSGWLAPYAIERGTEDDVPVFRIGIQDRAGWPAESWDEEAAEGFRDILRALRPDVVHFHAVQGLGAKIVKICHEEGIPAAVTLHDAWWLCERQFLVTGEGKYCGQHEINLNVCATCVDAIGPMVLRSQRLRQTLQDVELLLTPTRHWRRFYIANGFAPDRVRVNENGVAMPRNPSPNRGKAPFRFGYLGGAEPTKGFPVLKRTFEALDRDDWELVIVNTGMALGLDKFAGVRWNVKGTIRMIPPFDAETRDAFYDSIDVLLFPSQWPESFGLTVREALVRNKWVIATDQGGAAEAITAGVNGSIIPIGEDVAPFKAAVEAVLSGQPDLTGRVNPEAGRVRDFKTQADELRDLLASVTAKAISLPAAISAAMQDSGRQTIE